MMSLSRGNANWHQLHLTVYQGACGTPPPLSPYLVWDWWSRPVPFMKFITRWARGPHRTCDVGLNPHSDRCSAPPMHHSVDLNRNHRWLCHPWDSLHSCSFLFVVPTTAPVASGNQTAIKYVLSDSVSRAGAPGRSSDSSPTHLSSGRCHSPSPDILLMAT